MQIDPPAATKILQPLVPCGCLVVILYMKRVEWCSVTSRFIAPPLLIELNY